MKRTGLLVSALAALLAAASAASADGDAQFYKGKTIRVVVGYSPGGGYDTNARVFARWFGKHVPGSPAVVVENMPGASSLKSVQYLNDAPFDGTVITAFSAGLVIQSQIDPKHFPIDLTRFSWLGSIGQEIRVCYVRADTGVKTWAQMLAKNHLVFGETGTGSAGYIDQSILREVFGVRLKTILGYPGSAEKNIAIERGELDGDCISFTSIPKALLRDKKINVIYRSSDHILPGMPPGTPYVMDLTSDPKKKALLRLLLAPTIVGRPYIVSPKTAKDRLAILRAAFDATVKDPDFLAEEEKANLAVVGPMNGPDAAAYIAGASHADPEMIARVKKITGG